MSQSMVIDLEAKGRVEQACTFTKRLRGLLGRSEMNPGDSLLIRPCNAVHTAFMRFTIDVIFLSMDGQVLKVASQIKPWRMAIGPRGSCAVLEMPGGQAMAWSIVPGVHLAF